MEEKKYYEVYPQNDGKFVKVNLDKEHMPFKLLAHPDKLKKYIGGEEINPIHVRVGLTNSCNLKCNFCNFHSTNEETFYDEFTYKDTIDTSKMKKYIKDFKDSGGMAITFCGSGECTIHKEYIEICQYANKTGVQIGLITNGSMLANHELLECIKNTHTWVRIGLNAGSPETYQLITSSNSSNFNNILKAIRYLHENALCDEFRIGVNFVITLQNYKEIYMAGITAKSAGANYIRFEPEFYSALAHKTIYKKIIEINELLELTSKLREKDFEVSIPKLDRGAMTETDLIEGEFEKCHYCNFVTALGANGCMYPCPQIHLNSKYNMGNAINEGYTNWLKSGQKNIWLSHNSDRTATCKTCFYRPQNELLEKLVNGDLILEDVIKEYTEENTYTLHKNFI